MSLRTLLVLTTLLPTAALAESRSVCNTNGRGLNVRSSPSIHGSRIAGLSEGADFETLATSRNGNWVKVRLNGRTGWISRNYTCAATAGGGTAGGSADAGGNGGGGAASGGGGGGGGGNGGGSGSSDGGGGGDPGEVSADSSSAPVSSGGFTNPVPGSCRSSNYGSRRDPIHGGRRFHDGSDFAAPNGTPMRAAFSGTVVRAGQTRGYGYAVVIRRDNPDGSSTLGLYGHMCCGNRSRLGRSSIKVRVGERVQAGQLIGQVGNTGRSTGPHLHLLMRHVPAGAAAGYRNPNTSAFFSRRYSVNPERYISVGGCGRSRRGSGGDDHDHADDEHADDAEPAGMSR